MATMPPWPPELLHWLLFSLVLVAAHLSPLPKHLHPVFMLRQVAAAMARKVLKPASQSRAQQRISGLMALLTLLLPWLLIAALAQWMSDMSWLFAAILLFICLSADSASQDMKRIQQALEGNHKHLARELVTPFLHRDTHTLSPVGLYKAAIEGYSRHLVGGWLATLVWFLLLGPVAALAHRMLYEVAQQWPLMRREWHDFGFAANYLYRASSWPAHLLAWLLFALRSLLGGKVLPWAASKQPFMHAQDLRLWRALSARLHVQLGGPVMLDSNKQQRPRFDYGPLPTAATLQRCLRLMRKWQIACWLLFSPLLLSGISNL